MVLGKHDTICWINWIHEKIIYTTVDAEAAILAAAASMAMDFLEGGKWRFK
jgi:hypothetical protein